MLRELIKDPPIVASVKDRLSSILPKMKELKVHTAPVVNESRKLVGILEYRELLRRKAPLGSRVQSLMIPPHALKPDLDLDNVVRRFYETRLREYPVVDANGRLMGIVPRGSLLMAIKDSLANIKVSQYATKPALTIGPNDDVARARWIMIKHGVSRLPVVDGGKLIGIVTLTDLVEKIYYISIPRRARRGEVYGEEEFLAAPVSNVMSTNVYTIDEDQPLSKAVDIMVNRGVTGLVVTKNGEVAGVISGSDILKAYLDSRKVVLPIQARIDIDESSRPLVEKVVNNYLEKISRVVNIIDFKVDVRSRDSGRRFEVSVRLKDERGYHTATADDWDVVSAIRKAMDKVLQSILKEVNRTRDTKRRAKRGEYGS